MAEKKAEKPKYTSKVGDHTVEWFFRRGYYDATVKNAAGETIRELEYPKLGPHNTLLLDDFAREAVAIATR